MKLTFRLILGLSILVVSCGSLGKTVSNEEKEAIKLFNQYTDAFNSRHLNKVLSFFSEDFAWISIKPKVFETLVNGRPQLIDSFDKYFQTYPDVRTKIIQLVYDEGYIWTREVVTWSVDKEKFTQNINAVYYLKNGKIQRLYYFEVPDENESIPVKNVKE